MKDLNVDTITDTLSWYKIWQFSEYNHTRVKTKTSQETEQSLQKFLEPTRKPKVISTDNYLEFGKSCEDLSWNHCTSTPHRSETNGLAERAVRRIKEGTSAVLLQSGLGNEWRADSMECYCYLRNIHDLLSDGKTPYERRFGEPFKGPIIPFGAMVKYHPIFAKDQSRLHQFVVKVLPGIFLGYALYSGEIWKGDIFVADIEELEEMNAQCKGSVNAAKKWILHFPGRRWNSQTLWERSVLRTSALIRDNPDRGEEGNLLGESDGSSSTPFQDPSPYDGDARNDFWSISGTLFTVITCNPGSNCTCREKRHSQCHWNISTWPGLQVRHWM